MRLRWLWHAPSLRGGKIVLVFLRVFSPFYALGFRLRQKMAKVSRQSVPVLCIGNLTVGGSGKTPTALYVLKHFKKEGLRPHALTRGYGRRGRGVLRVDLGKHQSADVGDEALLLAREAPVWVGKDRVVSGAQAVEEGAEILVMDDGFQNPHLHKDFSILVADAKRGVGSGYVLPAGPLRESVQSGLARADILLLIGKGEGGGLLAAAREKTIPVFRGHLLPSKEEDALRGKRVLAYCGIGIPEKFYETLSAVGADIVERHSFPDHYAWREKDARKLLRDAREKNLHLITTEKDRARLKGALEGSALKKLEEMSEMLPIALHLEEEEKFLRFLRQALIRKRA